METFSNDIPTSWTTSTPNAVSSETAQGRVHSGNSSVNLKNGAILEQRIPINEGCYFDFSFHARGEGAQVGIVATVIFVTPTEQVTGTTITIAQQDLPNDNRNFAYFRSLTSAAPAGTTEAIIRFTVTASGGQSANIDDVSFFVQ